ncbi:MAG: hypothetical protein EOO60_09730 [Hymenobacter sp.]|nr:MAG: hypothetical protein EOO60_09730 [Hymenobacter sp.]
MNRLLRLLTSGLLLLLLPGRVGAQARQLWLATTTTHAALVQAEGTLWPWVTAWACSGRAVGGATAGATAVRGRGTRRIGVSL